MQRISYGKRDTDEKIHQGHEKVKGPVYLHFYHGYPCGQHCTGLDSIWKTIEDHSEAMYEATNLSDLWVTVAESHGKGTMGHLKGISKVWKRAEKRFTMNADTDIKGNPTLRVYTISDRSVRSICRNCSKRQVLISRGGAVLDKTFAEKNGLTINDEISIEDQ